MGTIERTEKAEDYQRTAERFVRGLDPSDIQCGIGLALLAISERLAILAEGRS